MITMSSPNYKETVKGFKVIEKKDQKGIVFYTVECAEGYVSGCFKFKDRAEKACKRIASNIVYKHGVGKVVRVK